MYWAGMGNQWLGDLTSLAATQDGVFSASQAEAMGIPRQRLSRAVVSGVLARRHSSVYFFASTPMSDRAAIRAATLQLHASVASHESALRLHGVVAVPADLVLSVGNQAHHRIDGLRIHRVRDLAPAHRAVVGGIPTTTLERAVIDVSCVFGRARYEHLIDAVTITRRMTSVGSLARVLRQVNRHGRLGIGKVGATLDLRRPNGPAPRSTLERRVDELLDGSPLPIPLPEHPLPTDGRYRGFVDRAWPEAMLILEIDGRTWHSREQDVARDRARDREAARHGWQTLRVLDEEVDEHSDAVLDDIMTTYAQRVMQLGRSA
jgi:hypothetical protein